MKGWSLLILLWVCCLLPSGAQQMSVEDFTRLKRPIWNRSKVTVDKKMALLDLITEEKGFEFTAGGNQPVEVEEGEGMITLKLPHKSMYINIKHPDYGQCTFRVPVKWLKKKKRYKATLLTYNPDKEYKLKSQWALFDISPENAILKVDSMTELVRKGTAEFYLPLGMHTYHVEAPFHEEVTDSFCLTDTAKVVVPVILQPFYSYLTVKSPWPNGDLYVDNMLVVNDGETSFRLTEGSHHVALVWNGDTYYDGYVNIGRAEKKVIEVKESELYLRKLKPADAVSVMPKRPTASKQGEEVKVDSTFVKPGAPKDLVYAPITLDLPDEDLEVWIDREKVGKGSWKGMLPVGYHIISTMKDGQQSASVPLWVENGNPVELKLAIPQSNYGMLNIHSNVTDAHIYIDGQLVGKTPYIVQQLDASRSYEILLKKEGYKEKKQIVRPRGNGLIEVEIKLKKK